jgi:hypothetical protein
VIHEPGESRREWMGRLFREAAAGTNQNQAYMFWQKTNKPFELTTASMFGQKMEYIRNNPVKEGLVTLPEHYAYSSAHPESPLRMFGE